MGGGIAAMLTAVYFYGNWVAYCTKTPVGLEMDPPGLRINYDVLHSHHCL